MGRSNTALTTENTVVLAATPSPIETAATIWAHVHGLVSLRLSGHLANAGDEEEFARFYRRSTEKLVAGLSVNTVHKKEKS